VNAFSCAGVPATTPRTTDNKSAPTTVKILVKFMAATVVGPVSPKQANSKKKNRCRVASRGLFHFAYLGAVVSR
jgi:hypothetical protein